MFTEQTINDNNNKFEIKVPYLFCSGCDPDLVHQRHYWPRRCGPPHKKPAECLRGPRGPPGTPGQTRYSKAGKQFALPAGRSPETGGVASSLSGRSAVVCTTSQLQNKQQTDVNDGWMQAVMLGIIWQNAINMIIIENAIENTSTSFSGMHALLWWWRWIVWKELKWDL